MNWEIIRIVIDLSGLIAILLTLVYLAKQIRDNTRIAGASARQAISDSLMHYQISYFTDEKFRVIFNDHLKNKPLNAEDMLYLETYSYFYMRSYENIFYQFRKKLISQEDWAAYRTNLKALCQIPAIINFWKREKENFSKTFIEMVDSILDELKKGPGLMPDALFQPKEQV